MKTASIAGVKKCLSEKANRTQTEGPIVVTRNGEIAVEPIASADDDDSDWILLSNSPRLQALLDRSRKSIAEGKGIPHNEFWRQVEERQGKKLAVQEKQGKYKTKKTRSK